MTTDLSDPIDAVRAYAPSRTLSPTDVDRMLGHVEDAIADPPPAPVRFRRRRPRLAAVGIATAVVLAGAGAAAASGLVTPAEVTRAFDSFVTRDTPTSPPVRLAEPATARQVFSVPGPDGTTFQAWSASNNAKGRCVITTYKANGSSLTQSEVVDGGQCAHADAPHGLFAEGTGGSYGPGAERPGQVHADFVYEAGDAVRAELRVSTGATLPVAVRDGWLGGWYDFTQLPLGSRAEVVAFGPGGTVLGRMTVLDQAGCDTPC